MLVAYFDPKVTEPPNEIRSQMSTLRTVIAQKIKFSIKNFFSKCDKIRRFLPI